MAEVRKWEDLKFDCLVHILRRVGIASLLLDVPFVCKSWHKASLDHSCWQHLNFTLSTGNFTLSENISRFKNEYRVNNFSVGGLIRLGVARGFGKSTSVVLPSSSREMDLYHVSERCHELTSLSLWFDFIKDRSVIPKLIGKWKLLEELTLATNFRSISAEVIYEIGENCKKLCKLTIFGGCRFTKEVSVAIANHIPKIKKLSLLHCKLEEECLEIIILGCKDLQFLDISQCKDIHRWDEKKLKDLAVHINTFNL